MEQKKKKGRKKTMPINDEMVRKKEKEREKEEKRREREREREGKDRTVDFFPVRVVLLGKF